LKEVEKYSSIVGFEPETLELIANMLTNFAEMTAIICAYKAADPGSIFGLVIFPR